MVLFKMKYYDTLNQINLDFNFSVWILISIYFTSQQFKIPADINRTLDFQKGDLKNPHPGYWLATFFIQKRFRQDPFYA